MRALLPRLVWPLWGAAEGLLPFCCSTAALSLLLLLYASCPPATPLLTTINLPPHMRTPTPVHPARHNYPPTHTHSPGTATHPPLEPRSGPGWGRAIINGTWKALSFFKDQPLRLYDLAADVYEVHDLAAAHPDVVQALGDWGTSQHVDQPDFPVANCLPS